MLARKSKTSTAFLVINGIMALLLILAFLKIAKVIVLPVILSVFLAFLLSPIILKLQKRNMPILPAALLSLALVFAVIVGVVLLLSVSVRSLGQVLPQYSTRFDEMIMNLTLHLNAWGIQADLSSVAKMVNPGTMADVIGRSLGFLMSLIKYGVIMFFTTLFMLLEGARFRSKLDRAFGKGNGVSDSFRGVGLQIQRYLLFKTLISLATGILVWGYLSWVGLDFPLLWGLVTFLLNFIPSVGSIVASIPPILLALVQFEAGVKYGLIVAGGLLTIQTVIGNYLDPKIMGQNLNLSTLVIFISMISWGWIWGPIGMLIAVPLTVCLKVALAHHPRTERLAQLMES